MVGGIGGGVGGGNTLGGGGGDCSGGGDVDGSRVVKLCTSYDTCNSRALLLAADKLYLEDAVRVTRYDMVILSRVHKMTRRQYRYGNDLKMKVSIWEMATSTWKMTIR